MMWHAGTGTPIVNAGPWGRDYHARFERMHIGYGFTILPTLLVEICRDLLNA